MKRFQMAAYIIGTVFIIASIPFFYKGMKASRKTYQTPQAQVQQKKDTQEVSASTEIVDANQDDYIADKEGNEITSLEDVFQAPEKMPGDIYAVHTFPKSARTKEFADSLFRLEDVKGSIEKDMEYKTEMEDEKLDYYCAIGSQKYSILESMGYVSFETFLSHSRVTKSQNFDCPTQEQSLELTDNLLQLLKDNGWNITNEKYSTYEEAEGTDSVSKRVLVLANFLGEYPLFQSGLRVTLNNEGIEKFETSFSGYYVVEKDTLKNAVMVSPAGYDVWWQSLERYIKSMKESTRHQRYLLEDIDYGYYFADDENRNERINVKSAVGIELEAEYYSETAKQWKHQGKCCLFLDYETGEKIGKNTNDFLSNVLY